MNLSHLHKEILDLKVKLLDVNLRKAEIIKNQQYELATNLRDEQNSYIDRMQQIRTELSTQYDALELTPENFELKQEIKNILLEFNEVDEAHKSYYNAEIRKRYDDLIALRKKYQDFGDTDKAKKIYLEIENLGKFLGLIAVN